MAKKNNILNWIIIIVVATLIGGYIAGNYLVYDFKEKGIHTLNFDVSKKELCTLDCANFFLPLDNLNSCSFKKRYLSEGGSCECKIIP